MLLVYSKKTLKSTVEQSFLQVKVPNPFPDYILMIGTLMELQSLDECGLAGELNTEMMNKSSCRHCQWVKIRIFFVVGIVYFKLLID